MKTLLLVLILALAGCSTAVAPVQITPEMEAAVLSIVKSVGLAEAQAQLKVATEKNDVAQMALWQAVIAAIPTVK
jgi:dihydropteroate synthase